jgi:hypothetical protein
MIIVGLSGGIGHGKTTFAEFLAESSPKSQHYESSDLIIAVANDLCLKASIRPDPGDILAINSWLTPLPAILQKQVGILPPLEKIVINQQSYQSEPELYTKLNEYLALIKQNPELANATIDKSNKIQFRSIQQWLGGYLVLKLGGIWYEEIVRQIRSLQNIDLVTVGGVRFPSDGMTLQQAGGVIVGIDRPVSERDVTDLTERERQAISVDIMIHNNGTLEQLRKCADKLLVDLKAGHPSHEYSAVTF